MRNFDFRAEAENCRQKALSYLGRPEAPFLLRVAREFDRLAKEARDEPDSKSDPDLEC
jgi:hypothetical protein